MNSQLTAIFVVPTSDLAHIAAETAECISCVMSWYSGR
jgi:hypothetical protein